MKAAVLKEYEEPLAFEELDTPTAGPDDVVIEMTACGICRSDLHGWQGTFPLGTVPGHEPAGTVVEVGENVDNFVEGDEVIAAFNNVCGQCPSCWSGHSNLCENIRWYGFTKSLGGAFASHLWVPNADINCVHVPTDISATDMAGLGCRFITAFHGVAHRADVSAGDWVAVHGCGGIGLSAINVATALGGNVIGIDIADEKLRQAEKMGAVETIDSTEVDDIVAEIHDITDGGADLSIDALGIPETCSNSLDSVGKLGTHLQIGEAPPDPTEPVEFPVNDILVNEVEITSAQGFPPTRFDEIFRLMESGKLQPQQLVTNHVALEDVNDRLKAMRDYQTVGVEVITSFD
ncbi:MAG: alcohol dehydrogenase catalytic domain-containing protein [Haloarculaceae archaeon]